MHYKKMYLQLFDSTANVIEALTKSQQEAERLYIEHNNTAFEFKRPDVADEYGSNAKIIAFHVDDKLHKAVKIQAEKENKSLQKYIVEILVKTMEDNGDD